MPAPSGDDRGRNRYGREPRDIGPGKPPLSDSWLEKRRPDADDGDENHDAEQCEPRLLSRPLLKSCFGLGDEPGRAEQNIAEHESAADDKREWLHPVEHRSRELPSLHFVATDESAEHDTLRVGREQGPPEKRLVPHEAAPLPLHSKLQCHAAKNEAQQHYQDRKIVGRNYYCEGK